MNTLYIGGDFVQGDAAPIVVTNPTLESDELRQFQRLLPSARSAP